MPYPVRDMRNCLLRKLHCQEVEGRRHTLYLVYHQGKVVASTNMSRGDSEVYDPLFSQMAKELCIQSTVLKKLYRCPYDFDDYLGGH